MFTNLSFSFLKWGVHHGGFDFPRLVFGFLKCNSAYHSSPKGLGSPPCFLMNLFGLPR